MEPRRVPLRHRVCMVMTVYSKERFSPLFCIPAFPHLVLNYFFLHLLPNSSSSSLWSISGSFAFLFIYSLWLHICLHLLFLYLFSLNFPTLPFSSRFLLPPPGFSHPPSCYYFHSIHLLLYIISSSFSLYSYCLHIFCFPFRDLPVRIILTSHLHFPFVHFFSLPSCYLFPFLSSHFLLLLLLRASY
jgi:hypothetical protein